MLFPTEEALRGTNLLWQQSSGAGEASRPGTRTLQSAPLAGTLAGGGDELDQAVGEDGRVEGIWAHGGGGGGGGGGGRGDALKAGASLIGGSWSGPRSLWLLGPVDRPGNGAGGLESIGILPRGRHEGRAGD